MKTLFIFPPVWDINLSPMLSLPVLAGMLKSEGHQVEIIDINAKFMNFVLDKSFLDYFQKQIDFYKKEIDTLHEENSIDKNRHIEHYLNDVINEFYGLKYNMPIFYQKNTSVFEIIKLLSKKDDSNLNNFYGDLKNFSNHIFERFLEADIPEKYRFFHNWEQTILDDIIQKSPELIGFSINSFSQFLWANIFAKKIKETCNTKIIYGGSGILFCLSKIRDFNTFVDGLIYGEGETAFRYLANGEPLKNVPSLIWKDVETDKIILNVAQKENSTLDIQTFKNLRNLQINYQTAEKDKTISKSFQFYTPNYNGINFDDYFLPQKIITLEGSRGCYWNKCEFCLYCDGTPYKQKNINSLIEEIKEYVNKYNVHKFYFTDSAIHPKYAEEFSRKILENKLNIQYISFVRLEKDFDYDLLKLMYDGGLRYALWGLESGSDRILQMYNKGTTTENNAKILKNASDIGISNLCWVITGFPKETMQDLILTRNFLIENHKYINTIQVHSFRLYKYAPMGKHLDDFDVNEDLFKNDIIVDFQPSMEVKHSIMKLEKELQRIYQNNLFLYGDLSNVMVELSKM